MPRPMSRDAPHHADDKGLTGHLDERGVDSRMDIWKHLCCESVDAFAAKIHDRRRTVYYSLASVCSLVTFAVGVEYGRRRVFILLLHINLLIKIRYRSGIVVV